MVSPAALWTMVPPVTSAGSRWLVGQCCVTPYGALKPHCVTAKNNAMEEYLSEKERPLPADARKSR